MSNILRSQLVDRTGVVLGEIAANLRYLRKAKGMSQSTLAVRSGLSRRMISAIEGAKANISIQSLDQLATALDVPFARLVRPASATDSHNIGRTVWQGSNADSSGKLLGTAVARNEAEFWLWSLAPGDRYNAASPSSDWHEMVFVLEGTLEIEVGEVAKTLTQGQFHLFAAPCAFAFVNNGPHQLRFVRSVIG